MSSPEQKISKSDRLRKYESVYNRLIKEQQTIQKNKVPKENKPKIKEIEKKSKKSKQITSKKESSESGDKKLNTYQLFVKNECKKPKYKGLDAKERMSLISTQWKKEKIS
jgi:hypothetical protein